MFQQDDMDIIVPIKYRKWISIVHCEEPTDKELQELPILDLINPTGIWNPKDLPMEEFDLQLWLETLNIRENRRAKMPNRAQGSMWD